MSGLLHLLGVLSIQIGLLLCDAAVQGSHFENVQGSHCENVQGSHFENVQGPHFENVQGSH